MGLVDLALVALVEERGLRQHGRAAGRCDQHRVGARGDGLQALRGQRGIAALKALRRSQLDAGRRQKPGHHLGPVLAVGVGGADQAHALDAGGLHVVDQRVGDQVVVLGGLEDPLLLLGHRQHHRCRADRREHRHTGFGGELDDAHRVGRAARADEGIDLVLVDELLDRRDRGRRVGRVVQREVLDLLAGHFLGQQRHGVLLRNADQRDRAARRRHDADLDLGMRGTGDTQGGSGGDQRGKHVFQGHGKTSREEQTTGKDRQGSHRLKREQISCHVHVFSFSRHAHRSKSSGPFL